MDNKLAAMLARRKQAQEEAEEEEWRPKASPKQQSTSQDTGGNTDFPPAKPESSRRASGPDLSKQIEPKEEIEKPQLEDSAGPSDVQDLDEMDEMEPLSREEEDDAAEVPPRATAAPDIDDTSEVAANPGVQFEDADGASASSPLPGASMRASSAGSSKRGSVEDGGPIKTILKPSGSFKGGLKTEEEAVDSPGTRGGLRWREERLTSEIDITQVQSRPPKYSAEDQSTVAYRMKSGQDVPVLVIPTGDNWRTGAQASSTAFNTLQNQLGINLRENPKEVPDPKVVSRAAPPKLSAIADGQITQSFKGKPPADTMAKAKSRVVSSYNSGTARHMGHEPLFPNKADPVALMQSPSRAASEGEDKTPVAAAVLALSTGTVEERAEAARRICRRARSAQEVAELVDAGVIGSIGPLLSDPRAVDAAIEALLRLCSGIKEGPPTASQDQQVRMETELCSSLEDNGVAERLAALICWSRDELLKGRMALLIFHMAQNHNLANRVIVQDGAIAALVHLLDSPMESASASAAAALANISYWSTEPAPRLSHFKILCAL